MKTSFIRGALPWPPVQESTPRLLDSISLEARVRVERAVEDVFAKRIAVSEGMAYFQTLDEARLRVEAAISRAT